MKSWNKNLVIISGGRRMRISTKGYRIDLRSLVKLTGRLNGASTNGAVRIQGMFFRVQDFESSANRLIRQLHKEGFAALKYLGKVEAGQNFSEKMKKEGIRLSMHSKSSFNTYDLSPMLRHFLNDACRILEPMVGTFSGQFPAVSASAGSDKTVSFNTYLQRLTDAGFNAGVDNSFFLALYKELWNDYKHAESNGIHAGGWHLKDEGTLSHPKLSGDRLNYFKDMTVEDFYNLTLRNMDKVLDVIA